MYYAEWLFLVVISVGVSLVAFIWGLRSGQFSDQERARYLPLGTDLLDEPIISATPARRRTYAGGLLFIVFITFAAMVVVLALAISHQMNG